MKAITRVTSIGTIAALLLITGFAADSSDASQTDSTAKSKSKAEAKAEKQKKKTKAKYNPVANPSKVKFGEFKRVEVKPTSIADKHANHKGNQESAVQIDSMLQQQLRMMFNEVVALPKGAEFSKPAGRTLQITPHIKDIRLITTGSRVWLGPMAGNSDLLMQVTYRDSSTGEVIADPEVAANNNAWSGGWTMGATDNQIRDNVVREIMGYMVANK